MMMSHDIYSDDDFDLSIENNHICVGHKIGLFGMDTVQLKTENK